MYKPRHTLSLLNANNKKIIGKTKKVLNEKECLIKSMPVPND